MTAIRKWNADELKGFRKDRKAVIVSTGPSYDDFREHEKLLDYDVFAINAAITELKHLTNVWWVCHDLFKIWRHGFRKRIAGYENWRLITRKVYLPGNAGNVPYRAVGGGRISEPFNWRIDKTDMANIASLNWYTELPELDGYMRPTETSVEAALDVLAWWGYDRIAIVGVDCGPVDGRSYACPWEWKRCAIKPHKFKSMANSLKHKRKSWPEDIFSLSKNWRDCPFKYDSSLSCIES